VDAVTPDQQVLAGLVHRRRDPTDRKAGHRQRRPPRDRRTPAAPLRRPGGDRDDAELEVIAAFLDDVLAPPD